MKLNGRRNQCPSCNKYFNSVTAFEMHRTGQYGVNRRCKTEEEMKAAGMFLPEDGFWRSEKMEKYYGDD